MQYILFFFYLFWFVCCLISQFSENFRKKIVKKNILKDSLMPRWRLFSPHPIQGEYRIAYRTYNSEKKQWSLWITMNHLYERSFFAILYNPNARILKSLNTICKKIDLNTSNDSHNYFRILNYLRYTVRQNEMLKNDTQIQFKIIWASKIKNLISLKFSSNIDEL